MIFSHSLLLILPITVHHFFLHTPLFFIIRVFLKNKDKFKALPSKQFILTENINSTKNIYYILHNKYVIISLIITPMAQP